MCASIDGCTAPAVKGINRAIVPAIAKKLLVFRNRVIKLLPSAFPPKTDLNRMMVESYVVMQLTHVTENADLQLRDHSMHIGIVLQSPFVPTFRRLKNSEPYEPEGLPDECIYVRSHVGLDASTQYFNPSSNV